MDLRSTTRARSLKINIPSNENRNHRKGPSPSSGIENSDNTLYDNEGSPIFLSAIGNLENVKNSEVMDGTDVLSTAVKTKRTPPRQTPPMGGETLKDAGQQDPDATPPFKGKVQTTQPHQDNSSTIVASNLRNKGYDGTGPGGSGQPQNVDGVTDMDIDEDRAAREKLHHEEQQRKLKMLRDEQQHYVMPGENYVATDSGILVANGDEASNSRVIAGHMLNYLDIQQKKNYDVFWNVNRIEMMHNAKVLRVTGHGIANPYDKQACYNWWLLVLDELEAPQKHQDLPQGVIHFSTDSGDNRQSNDRGATRPPARPNTTLFIEFPTSELPKWVLNSGVKLCRRLQSKRGMERLSFNPKLTTFEIKVQQYTLQVVQKIRENLNGNREDKKDCLRDVIRVRGIGRLKEHAALFQTDGKEYKVYYNKLISDPRTRPFLPVVGGVTVMPPTDFTTDPQDISLMEIDYKAEAAGLGLEVVGKKRGVVMKVPEYVMPSLKKKMNAEPNQSNGRESGGGWFKLSGSNGVGLGQRNPPNRTLDNEATPRDEYRNRQNENSKNYNPQPYKTPNKVAWNDTRNKSDSGRQGYKDEYPSLNRGTRTAWKSNSYGDKKHEEGDYAWSTSRDNRNNNYRTKTKDTKSNPKSKTCPATWMKHKGESSKRASKDRATSDEKDSEIDSDESGYQERHGSKRKRSKRSPARNKHPSRKSTKEKERSKYHSSHNSGKRSERRRSRDRGHSRGRYRNSKRVEDSSSSSSSSSSSESGD